MSRFWPVAMTSHFPYLGNESTYDHFGFWKVMNYFCDDTTHDNFNFCISNRDVEYFKSKGAREDRLFRIRMGASEEMDFKEPTMPERSLYLGKLLCWEC
jgi:hypothetical protein